MSRCGQGVARVRRCGQGVARVWQCEGVEGDERIVECSSLQSGKEE